MDRVRQGKLRGQVGDGCRESLERNSEVFGHGESLPDQNLTQRAGQLLVDVFLGVAELEVHVRVDADESALVFRLAPLESNKHVLVDPARALVLCVSKTVPVDFGAGKRGLKSWALNVCLVFKGCARRIGVDGNDVQILDHRAGIYRNELRRTLDFKDPGWKPGGRGRSYTHGGQLCWRGRSALESETQTGCY